MEGGGSGALERQKAAIAAARALEQSLEAAEVAEAMRMEEEAAEAERERARERFRANRQRRAAAKRNAAPNAARESGDGAEPSSRAVPLFDAPVPPPPRYVITPRGTTTRAVLSERPVALGGIVAAAGGETTGREELLSPRQQVSRDGSYLSWRPRTAIAHVASRGAAEGALARPTGSTRAAQSELDERAHTAAELPKSILFLSHNSERGERPMLHSPRHYQARGAAGRRS